MKKLTDSNLLPVAAAGLLLFAAGCGRDSVKVYHVDNSDLVTSPPPVAASATMPDGLPVPDNSGQPKLKYTLPDGWKEKALTQLRVASFEISENGKTADVSVIPLGGMAGGDAANVNRWRGQVGQSPVDETDLKKSAEAVEVAGKPADLYDITGTSPGSGDPERIVGAILHSEDTAWYFKMMGDAALAEKNKPAFIAFLKSVEFQKPDAPSTMDLSQLLASHPAIPGLNAQTETTAGSADKPTWTIPADWKEGEVSQFVLAKFNIQSAGDATAAVSVSQLAGDGGGFMPNVNRWRKQIGLAAAEGDSQQQATVFEVADGKASLVDMTGTDPRSGKPARLVGVVLPRYGQTWFYKLMGDPDLVAQQKDALIKFVQSAKYPAAK
jgi:hypothetical protein